jgi:general nucleoside transport system ATP-binding protein
MSTSDAYRIELSGVTKAFPGVLANDDVSFAVKPGEIHALLGENGAGKSTLVKMIYGIMQPDRGQIILDGKPTHIANPKAARAMGIGMVFQHFSLFEAMTVLENIALGLDHSLSHSKLEHRINEVLHQYGLALDPHRVVSTLSVGERQRIEIVRALLLNPTLLIMDEPTSVLTPQEVAQLFETLRSLAASGCSILYISHKLHEIKELCSGATILRGGKVVGECNPKQESSRSMAELMIGGTLKETEKAPGTNFGDPKFVVTELSLPGEGDFGISLKDINFSVRAGEIFGIAGVAGNGQNELLLALSGEVKTRETGAIKLDDKPLGMLGTTARRFLGLCAVPEERNGHGAVPSFSLCDNAILTARNRKHMVNWGVINTRTAETYTEEVIHTFAVKTTGPGSAAGSLSGGNLQKFIMGREIMQTPEVLVVSQPTWGVDAGAAAAIHQALIDLAARGSAIVVISQDLDELLAVCDQMAVINEGRLSKTLKVGEATIDEIGLLMGGVHGDPLATAEMTRAVHVH